MRRNEKYLFWSRQEKVNFVAIQLFHYFNLFIFHLLNDLFFQSEFGTEQRNLGEKSSGRRRQQSEVVQEDLFNNSGQAVNSDWLCDPAVHIQTGDNLIYSLPAVSTFL